jgi:UDP-N-acetylmuramoyl-tripeptide--D-alanyl-D-alanine ligase
MMKSLWDALSPTRQGGYAGTAEALAPLLTRAIEPGDLVMVKGSRDSKAKVLFEALSKLDSRGEAV